MVVAGPYKYRTSFSYLNIISFWTIIVTTLDLDLLCKSVKQVEAIAKATILDF